MGSSVRDKIALEDAPIDHEAIKEQLERLLESSVFRNSKRYPAFLRYIIGQTLEGRESNIKERILGIEVFGRSPDYDTNSDHVVRTAAGEIRKRLAQYYMEPGRELEMRIDVPPGSYVPQFKAAPRFTLTRPREETLAPDLTLASPWRKHARALLIVSAIVNIFLLLVFAEQGNLKVMARGETTLQKFWAPLLRTGAPVLLCVGTRDQIGTNPTPQTNQDPLMRRVAMADVLPLARISTYIGKQGVPYHILNPAATSFTDLRNGPAVLIGAGNNSWARQLTDRLRFSFTTNGPTIPENVGVLAIRDSQHPGNHNWVSVQEDVSDSTIYREYGLISRLLNPQIEQVIVAIGSLGPHATEAAGELITDPVQIKKLDAFTMNGWSNKNMQIVVSAEVVRGKSGPPKIEAVWFW
jgi:hypothetical protein